MICGWCKYEGIDMYYDYVNHGVFMFGGRICHYCKYELEVID